MKKWLCVLICVFMIPCSASSETSEQQLIADYNSLAETTCAFQLSEDNMSRKNNSIYFYDGMTVICFDKGDDRNFNGASVYAEDFESLISCSATCGLYFVRDAEYYVEFLGWLTYMYYRQKNGLESFIRVYGDYSFLITKSGNGFFFTIVKI